MTGPLRQQAFNGAAMTGMTHVIRYGIRILGVAVLARILLPEDFGVAAMAIVFINVGAVISDIGFSDAIIQRKNVTPGHLSTAFWLICLLGVVLAGIVVAISPLAAWFFHEERIGPILAVCGISFLIFPLGSIHGAILKKNLSFTKFSISEISGGVAYLASGVTLALLGFGVWSIILGGIAENSVVVISRWLLCRWHPSFEFDIEKFKELRSFGFNQVGTKLIKTLTERLDYLIVGRFLPVATLGFYNLGVRTIQFPLQGMSFVSGRVAFPVFSLMQDENKRLRNGFLKTVTYSSLFGIPAMAGLAVTAPELVNVLYGNNWGAAVFPMQILCIYGAVQLVTLPVAPALLSKGRPDVELKIKIAKLVLTGVSLIVGVQFGIIGVAASVAAAEFLFFPVRLIITNRLIGLSAKNYLISLVPAVTSSSIMASAIIGFRFVLNEVADIPNILVLISSILLGLSIYLLMLKIFKVTAVGEISHHLLHLFKFRGMYDKHATDTST